MEMINRAAYEDLKEAGMEDPQAVAIAAHIPDWSQFATRQDLSSLESRLTQEVSSLESRLTQEVSSLKSRLTQDMRSLESRLIRWMVGIFLTFLALLGGLVTLSLNIYGVLG